MFYHFRNIYYTLKYINHPMHTSSRLSKTIYKKVKKYRKYCEKHLQGVPIGFVAEYLYYYRKDEIKNKLNLKPYQTNDLSVFGSAFFDNYDEFDDNYLTNMFMEALQKAENGAKFFINLEQEEDKHYYPNPNYHKDLDWIQTENEDELATIVSVNSPKLFDHKAYTAEWEEAHEGLHIFGLLLPYLD